MPNGDGLRDCATSADRLRSGPRPAVRTRKPWIAAYADASWHEGSRKGGWALWIRTDTQRIVRWGPTPKKVRNSLHAEAAAVFAAVHEASLHFAGAAGLTVKTDCQTVVQAFNRGTSDALMRDWIDRAKALAKAANVDLRVTWVKGHQRQGSGTSGYLNNRVDEYARQARLSQTGGSWREAVEPTGE